MQDAITNNIRLARIKMLSLKNINQANKENIEKLKNKYSSKRCFIIGGSPSLRQLDLTKLENEYTFSVNYGFKLREFGLKHTTFHTIMDIYAFYDDNIQNILPDDFSDYFFFHSGVSANIKDKTLYLSETSKLLDKNAQFQFDITKPILNRRTVIYACLQIARYLGFSKIYLIGVDLDFSKISGHAYSENSNEQNREKTMSLVNENEMREGLIEAANILKADSKMLFNASPLDLIKSVTHVKYEDLF